MLNSKIKQNNNIGTIRFLAAFAVLFGHTYNLQAGKHGNIDPISSTLNSYLPFGYGVAAFGVIVFFVLSGYLVSASFDRRSNLGEFIVSRCLRIFPGLIASVCFCVFVVGPLFTTLPIKEYFSKDGTWLYLFSNSSLWEIRFSLPGVFENNPWKRAVNGSLWTLPIEFLMYFYVALFGALGFLKDRFIFNLFCVVIILLYFSAPDSFVLLKSQKHYYMGFSFLIGAFLYVNKEVLLIPRRFLLFLLAVALLGHNSKYYDFFVLIIFSSILLSIGFDQKFKLPKLDRFGDLSYGLYLYAFPLQQVSIYFLGGSSSPFLILMISFSGSLLLAYLSWNLVEKQALKLKGTILVVGAYCRRYLGFK